MDCRRYWPQFHSHFTTEDTEKGQNTSQVGLNRKYQKIVEDKVDAIALRCCQYPGGNKGVTFIQYELHVYINGLFGESENVNISQCVASCMASLQCLITGLLKARIKPISRDTPITVYQTAPFQTSSQC